MFGCSQLQVRQCLNGYTIIWTLQISFDRFFHSIGTAHLAYNLMKDLRSNQPELCISDRDVVCVVLAALMHDLGHPAYSHMFETFMASIGHTSWTHEQASTVLVKEVLRSVNLSLLTKDAEGDDEQFIVELIDPPKKELNTCLGQLARPSVAMIGTVGLERRCLPSMRCFSLIELDGPSAC